MFLKHIFQFIFKDEAYYIILKIKEKGVQL